MEQKNFDCDAMRIPLCGKMAELDAAPAKLDAHIVK